ncbi:MAG: cupin domain-containing protein [Gemmatimonadota bacterium]|nr:cupin domain-containing protein [Gemmatimonadota bacterium]
MSTLHTSRTRILLALALAGAMTLAGMWLAGRMASSRGSAPVAWHADPGVPAEAHANITARPVGAHRTADCTHLMIASEVAAHLHRTHDETVVILAGSGVMRLGEETLSVGPGSILLIPRGTVHALSVLDGPMEVVSVFSPPFDGKDRVFVE